MQRCASQGAVACAARADDPQLAASSGCRARRRPQGRLQGARLQGLKVAGPVPRFRKRRSSSRRPTFRAAPASLTCRSSALQYHRQSEYIKRLCKDESMTEPFSISQARKTKAERQREELGASRLASVLVQSGTDPAYNLSFRGTPRAQHAPRPRRPLLIGELLSAADARPPRARDRAASRRQPGDGAARRPDREGQWRVLGVRQGRRWRAGGGSGTGSAAGKRESSDWVPIARRLRLIVSLLSHLSAASDSRLPR